MMPSWTNHKSAVKNGAVCFALGTVGGCALGATVTPVNQAMTGIISESLLQPVRDGVRTVGALGLGTLLGATALSTTMASAAAGVTVAAVITLLLLTQMRNESTSRLVCMVTGVTASLSTASCGATIGFIIEKHIMRSGVIALLWALVIFTVLKVFIYIAVKLAIKKWKCFSILDSQAEEPYNETLDFLQAEHREKVTVEIEKIMVALETENSLDEEKTQDVRAACETQRRNRMELQQMNTKGLMLGQRSIQENLTNLAAKYVDVLTFSNIPMTVTASVTAALGILGFGEYRFVFVVLLALIFCMAFTLTRLLPLNFWMFSACVGMFATFAIAVLTVHAGQEVLETFVRIRKTGQVLSKEIIAERMDHKTALEAVTSGVFVSKMFQIALGATIGSSMNQKVLKEVIVGASVTTIALIFIVEACSVPLGIGGVTGALLGALGAAGVSTGAAAAVAFQCSSLIGTISTTAGMLSGALAFGNWDIINVGMQMLVVYMFAVIIPY